MYNSALKGGVNEFGISLALKKIRRLWLQSRIEKLERIGAGNKRFDQLVLGVHFLIVTFLFGMIFYDSKAIYLFIFFLVGSLINIIHKASFSYVAFDRDLFIIEKLFSPQKVIKAELFVKVVELPSATFISTACIIQFKNGEHYKVRCGFGGTADVRAKIQSLVTFRDLARH